MRQSYRRCGRVVLAFASLVLLPHGLSAQLNEYGNPLKLAPKATSAAITDADLRTRLYILADDSMMGRQFGREGNMKGTNYIARELEKLGVLPAGENGTYFQGLPAVVRKYSDKSALTADGKALKWLTDFVAVPGRGASKTFTSAQVIYGGVIGDTANQISAEQAAGKLVILQPPVSVPMQGGGRGGFGGMQRFAGAVAIATVDLQTLSPAARAFLNNPAGTMARSNPAQPQAPAASPVTLRITPDAAAALMGAALTTVTPGTMGRNVTASLDLVERPVPQFARNVVGIIRGSDPKLAGEYVAIGAHNDHVGYNVMPVDHDSARAVATAMNLAQIVGSELKPLTAEQRAAIKVNFDSIRAKRAVRRDSISNGADDDGSGTVAVLEIAEAIAKMPVKPHRSILLVFHTGEEAGLLGSAYYTDHPTVPRDSIVAQLNIDMIGRGRAGDLPGGSPDYLGVVGANRLSSELGTMVAGVNQKQKKPLVLDYKFDEPTTWPGYNNIYQRSDHYNYARFGIPIAFFFTGLHQDYHRVTDEPQYIDYPHMTRITQYIHDLTLEVANAAHRPVVDKPKT